MKKYEVHHLTSDGFSSKKDELSKEVQQFLNEKVNQGYEIVSVSFSYFETAELVAFITICK